MKKGDIILVKYPFTDLSKEKLRPALVLIPEDEEQDLLLAFITGSAIQKSHFDIFITKENTGLHKDSIVRLKKLMTIHRSLIAGRIGNVSREQWETITQTLKKMLDIYTKPKKAYRKL